MEGQHIIESLLEREDSESLFAFTELLFDRMGIDQEYLDENLQLVRPTENLATGQLPGLDEEGVTATYDRATALSRDDVTFLTWEHPIVAETMNALLGSDVGKASFGTFKHRGVPAGTVLLEAIHRVECLAPRYLQTGQFLDQQPLRTLLTQSGKDVTDKLSTQFFSEALQSVPSATSATALNKLRPLIETLLPTLEQATQLEIERRTDAALSAAVDYYGAEISRLRYLQRINPAVRDEEIATLTEESEACQTPYRIRSPRSRASGCVSRSDIKAEVGTKRERCSALLNRIGPSSINCHPPRPACRAGMARRRNLQHANIIKRSLISIEVRVRHTVLKLGAPMALSVRPVARSTESPMGVSVPSDCNRLSPAHTTS